MGSRKFDKKEAGEYLRHVGCPDCDSSDSLALYRKESGKIDGYCWSHCLEFKRLNQDTFETLAKEPLQEETMAKSSLKVSEITNDFDIKGSRERKLKKKFCELFGMRVGYADDGQTVAFHYYPFHKEDKVVGYQERDIAAKDFKAIGYCKQDVQLLGQHLFKPDSEKDITITEGFLDMVAVYQTLNERYKGKYPVVSLPAGATAKAVAHNIEYLNKFKSVIIMTDQDEPGQKVAEEISKMLEPGKAKIAKMSEKDPNAMLMEGKEDELLESYWDARPFKIQEVVGVMDVIEDACKMPEMGMSWPWPTLTELTYGIHRKNAYYLGAGVGVGKTNWAKQLQSWLVKEHDLPVGVFMLEEPVGKTLKGIAGKIVGKAFHKPDAGFTQEELREAITSLDGKVYLFNHFGTRDWEDIKAAIRYMVIAHGIKDIFLDNLTALVSHLSSGEANDEINKISGEVASMINELDFTVYGFSHLNAPYKGVPHERGGAVNEGQFTGSRGLMRYGHYLFGAERNKHPELPPEERNRTNFVLLKDRENGNVGNFCIEYDPLTDEYLEPKGLENWHIVRGDPDEDQMDQSRLAGSEFNKEDTKKESSEFEVQPNGEQDEY